MSNKKNRGGLDLETKKQFEIFKNAGETFMSFLFVINDPSLSSSAKLLFQLIYSLAASTGYCHFSDADLAENADITASAVRNGISALKKKGWITSEMVATNSGSRRKISIMYHNLRKDCPKNQKYEEDFVKFRGFAKEKKDKFCANAIATYVLCKKYRQEVMLIKPASYDNSLHPNIRIMFQLICSLSVIRGFCYARNYFFSDRMAVSKGAISNYVGILQEERLIRRSDYDRARYIYLNFDELKKRYLKGRPRKNN